MEINYQVPFAPRCSWEVSVGQEQEALTPFCEYLLILYLIPSAFILISFLVAAITSYYIVNIAFLSTEGTSALMS
jgi:hypothetical protein